MLRTTEFKRDNLGRIIASQIHQVDGQRQQTTYHYDPMGRLTQLADEQTDILFTYDNLGRVIEHYLSDKDGRSQAMRYTYDANGNRLTTTLPNGEQIEYHYYGSGHLSTIKFNDRLITDITRDKLHREVSRTQGKLVTSVKLDAIGRLEEQLATLEQQTTQPTPQALVNRTYRYNEVGNLIQSRDLRMGNQDYYYDKLGQLTMTGNEVFAFDPAHNLIERETDKLLNNQLHEYQGVTYRYDAFGNLSQRKLSNGEVQTYHYNAKDLLIKVIIQTPNQKAQEWHYHYDVLDRRIAKVRSENGAFLAHTTTEFMWDGSHLVQEINRENDRTFSYIYRSPQSYEPLAQVCTDNNHTQTRYFHCDQIGVPRELTDENGNLCWYGDYLGWGKLRNSHNLMADVHQPLRLQNQYADEETGLHYNFFRYYDPHIGRFTHLDPIGLQGGMNLYQFAKNTQVWSDSLGLSPDYVDEFGDYYSFSAAVVNRGIALEILSDTLSDMKALNLKGTDQFFHCTAFCRVSKSNVLDKGLTLGYGRIKEWGDWLQNLSGKYGSKRLANSEMLEDMNKDMEVNEYGFKCPSDQTCAQRCERYLDPNAHKTKEILKEKGYL